MTARCPLAIELTPAPDPWDVFLAVRNERYALFLDSALRDPRLGRYSYVAFDPLEVVVANWPVGDPLHALAHAMRGWQVEPLRGLPPFQGGAAGMLGYDLGATLERLPTPRYREFDLPRLAVGLYDMVVAFDHLTHRAWLVSHGGPATTDGGETARARDRLQFWQATLATRLAKRDAASQDPLVGRGQWTSCDVMSSDASRIPLEGSQVSVPGPPGLMSNFSSKQYYAAVDQALEHIAAGDIFQVNLAQRLIAPATCPAWELYARLRRRNPATFAAYFDLGTYQIVSASPERFVRLEQGVVETRPIKGTRRRASSVEADLFVGDDLRGSEKDRAENVMIVDLMRNDLARVCRPESVRVTQLCSVEIYQFVQHLVSAIRGELAPDRSPVDLLRATFPGGSITGAPKIRAMEIIAALEPHARGAYCGSLGYWSGTGAMDWNILIRTITAGRGWWQIPVGGGIVVGSDPRREYEETWHKAEGLLRSLEA